MYTHPWIRSVELLNVKHVGDVNLCLIQLYHGSISVFWWQCKRRHESSWWFCRLSHLHGCIPKYLGGDFRHGGFQLFRKGSCDFNHVNCERLYFVLYIFFVFIVTKMIKVIIIVTLLLKCVQKYLKSLKISGMLSVQVPAAMFSEVKHSKVAEMKRLNTNDL